MHKNKKMKLTKQNKLLIGLGVVGVVGYLYWKKSQEKVAFAMDRKRTRARSRAMNQVYTIAQATTNDEGCRCTAPNGTFQRGTKTGVSTTSGQSVCENNSGYVYVCQGGQAIPPSLASGL